MKSIYLFVIYSHHNSFLNVSVFKGKKLLEQELKIRTENFIQQATVTTKNNNKTVLMTNSLEQNEPQQTQHLSKQLNNRWLDG